MRKFLAFIIKICFITALAVWLASNPGDVQLHWLGYEIRTSAAFFTAAVFILVGVCLLVYKGLRFMLDGPRMWREHQRLQRLEKGQQRLLAGFVAVAAGDAAMAQQQARAVHQVMPHKPLTKLLLAQAADLSGDEEESAEHFRQLLQDSDSAVLGYRGLINLALRHGKIDDAKKYAAELGRRRADVPWLHMVNYDIALREKNWGVAGDALRQAYIHRQLGGPETRQRQAGLAIAAAERALKNNQAEQAWEDAQQARSLQPHWPPATLVLAKVLSATGRREKALRALSEDFRMTGDGEVARMFSRLLQDDSHADGPADTMVQWRRAQKFAASHPHLPDSHQLLADIALRAQLWGEARHHLLWLEQHQPHQHIYRQLAELEEKENNDISAARSWLEKALAAPPAPSWHCTSCQHTQADWSALCGGCDGLLTLSYVQNSGGRKASSQLKKLA